MEVHIKGSKCDQFAEGIKLVDETGSDLCPCSSSYMYAWVLVSEGNGPDPVFLIKDGRLLSHEQFVAALCSTLKESGIDPSLHAGRSFCVGAATKAAL